MNALKTMSATVRVDLVFMADLLSVVDLGQGIRPALNLKSSFGYNPDSKQGNTSMNTPDLVTSRRDPVRARNIWFCQLFALLVAFLLEEPPCLTKKPQYRLEKKI